MDHQQHDRKTPFVFEGVGRTSRVQKILRKCIGRWCNRSDFWAESKYSRMCPKCLIQANKLRSSLG